ncbi:MAG: efflux RND transporter periplasmic adaptor subunit [Nitrospirae bacterium]|nr:efflux RND transporter periplasmic adaptor subunit [Nitrospirota bacterium]
MTARSRWMLAVIAVATAGVVAWGVAGSRGEGGPKPPQGGEMRGMPVEAARVRVGAVTDEIAAVGSLSANESVVIRSEIPGRIASIDFVEGRTVKPGDALFRLDSAEAAAQVAQIEATLGLNRDNVERAKPLREAALISPQDFDQLAAKLKESEASLAVARERLNKTAIRAPFGGTLGLRQVSPGDYVQPGQALVNLEDVSTVKVDFRVPEARLGHLAVRQPVTVRVDAFPAGTFTGMIEALDPHLDTATRTVIVRARIPNPQGALLPGMFARVAVVVADRPNAVLIPEQAVVPVGDDAFVFRVVEGKAVIVKVVIGRRKDGEAEIVSGLSPEDVVVTGGQMKIRDGAPVTVINQGPGPGGPPPAAKG